MRIGTAAQVRKLDESVIRDYGVPQMILMENAAVAARNVVERRWGIGGTDILVVCGSGNNGGDGLALARLLYARGAAVTVLMAGDPSKLSGAAAENRAIVGRLPLEVLQMDSGPNPALLKRIEFDSYHLLVDALFGTGLSRPLQGSVAALVNRMNEADAPILALDIPSGISADTGQVLGVSIQAEATVTFGIPKRGNLIYPGYSRGGDLYVSEISFPPETIGDDTVALSVNVPPPLPIRDEAGHKGSFGKVLVIGGAPNYRGAPSLAGAAALKSGAGYVRLAVPSELVPDIFPLVPEAVFIPLETGGGALGAEHLPELQDRAAEASSAVIGPGLSTAPESVRLARDVIAGFECPLVVDGDALTALSGREELSRGRGVPAVLTPHPGEMARLLGSSVQEVESRRVDCAKEAADRYGAVVALKGAHTVVAAPSGEAWINLTGNAGMGTAGSGDVLAGVIGALAARMSPEDAVRLGVHLHGLAGDLAADELGGFGMTAGDILRCIPAAFAAYPGRIASDPFSGRIRQA